MSYQLWCWVVRERDGEEGCIAVIIPGSEHLGPMVLQARTQEFAMKLMPLAQAHSQASGNPCRLVHLVEPDK